MNALYFVAVIAAVAVAGVSGRDLRQDRGFSPLEEHPIDWYDCSGKADGNYEHPSECTKFISCSGGIASLRECADCHPNPTTCPEGQLVYNVTINECRYADETTCSAKPGPSPSTTKEPEQPEPTTPRATRPPRTTTTTASPTEDETTPAPTTQAPTTPAPGGRPKPGEDCNPEECKNTGWCQTFLRCDNETSTWVEEDCGQDLAWNPRGPAAIHGGNCDKFENLDEDLQKEYRSDKECLKCFWEEIDECSAKYKYQAPNLTHRNVQILSCTKGLVFVQAKETCQRCEDVQRSDGTSCC